MSRPKQLLKLVPPTICTCPSIGIRELQIVFFRKQLEKLQQPYPQDNIQRIIDYLTSGYVFSSVFEVMLDPFTDEFVGYSHVLSDGVWWWEQSLSDYVKKYHIGLPEEFIVHMKNNNWVFKNDPSINWEQLDYDPHILSDQDIESLDWPDISYEVPDYEINGNCKKIIVVENFDNITKLTRKEYKEYLRIKREWLLENGCWRVVG